MKPLLALALAELRMLVRNRTAAFNALALPIGMGVLWLWTGSPAGQGAGPIAALQVIAILSFTVYTVGTSTLVARRQQRALKRWRASAAPTWAILTGTLAPLAALLAVQVVILLLATGVAMGEAPAAPALIAGATLAGAVLCGALAFVTAAVTRTVESSMITVFPILAAVFGGAVWVMAIPPDAVTLPMLATGGGAVAHLARLGWDGLGGETAMVASSFGIVAALSAAAVMLATRAFRWDPRG